MQPSKLTLDELKESLIEDLNSRVQDKILEPSNRDLLVKLIKNAEKQTEAISIAELGTTYKRTGFHFDKKLEKLTDNIKYFSKNHNLSFVTDPSKLTHKLIIGDNYDALLNLSISYKGKIDVIYIDPPYGKDDMGEFAQTNYNNAITRDNLLSMLYSRLILARELLTDEGVIFCSIDDKNQAYVKCLFDEIFGEISFIGTLIWNQKLTGGHDSKNLNTVHEYILIYSKLVSNENILQKHKSGTEYPYKDKNGRSFKPDSLWVKRKVSKGTQYPIFVNPNKTNDLGYNLISPFESEEYPVKVLPYMCTDNPSESNKDSVRWFWCETKFSEKYLELCGAKYVDNQWKIYKKVYGDH